MITAIAIEDEPLALDVLRNHAQQLDAIVLAATFSNAAAGLSYLQANKIDALFLDIKMPDRSGIVIAQQLPPGLHLVFTTAYPQYAVKGFELDATDYLLKPITFTRFLQACNKIKQRMELPADSGELMIKENGAWIKLLPGDVQYIEAQGNYLKIVTRTHRHMVRQTLQEFEKSLPPYFLKIHKSYIINTRMVDRIAPAQVTIGFTTIPVSPTYKKELFSYMGLKNYPAENA